MLISVVVRTLNEERFLDEVLVQIGRQKVPGAEVEVVLVDSGSTDRTLEIARAHGCRITHIAQSEFSFGRSLNKGCEFAFGDVLVFLSGHCVPCDDGWLHALTKPILDGVCCYTYGRQVGSGPTKFSENRVFLKYYPTESMLPQEGFFANNANAAIAKNAWAAHLFDEEVTGLEDMELAKRLVAQDERVGYVAGACVFHIHDETWSQVKNRYEREGIALCQIMPEAGLSFLDFLWVTVRGIAKDSYAALRQRKLHTTVGSILCFRTLQYWGSYRGTRLARIVARTQRKSYFYPDRHFEKPLKSKHERRRIVADEGAQ